MDAKKTLAKAFGLYLEVPLLPANNGERALLLQDTTQIVYIGYYLVLFSRSAFLV